MMRGGMSRERGEAMKKIITRREMIGAFGSAGAAFALGCGSSPTSPSTTSSSGTAANVQSPNQSCDVRPTETVGPYPSLTDMFRGDIREDRSGTRLDLTVRVVNTNANCAAVSGANVEIWQCDATGNYSQYGSQTVQTYLRGIQTSNASG